MKHFDFWIIFIKSHLYLLVSLLSFISKASSPIASFFGACKHSLINYPGLQFNKHTRTQFFHTAYIIYISFLILKRLCSLVPHRKRAHEKATHCQHHHLWSKNWNLVPFQTKKLPLVYWKSPFIGFGCLGGDKVKQCYDKLILIFKNNAALNRWKLNYKCSSLTSCVSVFCYSTSVV